jgi:tricorn protease
VLIAAPLRADVELPWAPKSDEEEWDGKDEEEEDEEEDVEPDDEEGEDAEPETEDDGVSGIWEGTLTGAEMPPGMEFTLILLLGADGNLEGTITVPMGSGEVEGTYDETSGEISGTITTEEGDMLDFTGRITGESITMTVSMQGQSIEVKGSRTSIGVDEDDLADKGDDEAAEIVEIDIEGFEERCFQLPVGAGRFGNLAVNNKNQLLYARFGAGGTTPPSIMLFDIDDEKKQEKSVAKGSGSFEISGDGKKLLVIRGSGVQIQNASAGAMGKSVSTNGMHVPINPREEWSQLVLEAWRLERDFFYVDNMHGVDWPAVREQYMAMLDDCITRDDVSYVIRELIAELNVGHAYYSGGDVESQPNVGVGLLGVDWAMENGAYQIGSIYEGAVWDVDARSPLRGLDVSAGDYVLAVNGVPLDTRRDPWSAFVGTAGRAITITVSESPVMDENARDVVVKPISSEGNLRYRAWIEANRRYVAEQTDGQVGYVYVPNTGVDGQNDLYRQTIGQLYTPALIIDERWNGGGQIPTRFIEMLNRPITNYWARRDTKDWAWPPDGHRGPKCMMINGLAGSGGDMFPFLFKQAGLGQLVGMRTWGGLVGLSGNPGLIDGGRVTVPTFGFYEKDGTWGIEGHGVDPDIEVIDDPALMIDGGDPQLDAAIALMLQELNTNPYQPPQRPSPPDRSGMGIQDMDR